MSTLMSSMELKKKQGHCFILKLFSELRVTNSLSQTQHIVLFPNINSLILATLQSVSISFDLGMILFLLPVLNQLG